MSVHGARQRIETEVLTWPGVVSQPHRFGGTEFMLGKREVGHVHGDRLLDVAFPKPVRNEVVAAGLAEPHHVLPAMGELLHQEGRRRGCRRRPPPPFVRVGARAAGAEIRNGDVFSGTIMCCERAGTSSDRHLGA